MGFFDLFFRRRKHIDPDTTAPDKADVKEEQFIQKDQTDNEKEEGNQRTKEPQGISLLLSFLDQNHEGKGYDDALINPDGSHLEQNLQALRNEFERTVRRVMIFYNDFIRQVDFHIASRARSGMVDMVEELTKKKETAESHIKQVLEIEAQAMNNEGPGQGILISYARGFRNGLAAITGQFILRENF